VAGWLADRIGVRRVYLLGIFARTLSAAMLLFAGSFAGLMAQIVIAVVAEILALRVFGELGVWQRARLPSQPRYSPRATGGT
jgi:MFS family permease